MQKNILVVDEASLLMKMASRCLGEKGYTVTTANSGEEAFSFLNMLCFDLPSATSTWTALPFSPPAKDCSRNPR